MPVKPYIVQRRMMELGRVRLGEKGTKGEPKKLSTLRFTSASKTYLDALAAQHGGTVKPWAGAPEEGMFELVTKAAQIDIVLPPVFSAEDGTPTTAYSQWFELWSGGGCQRRCDGETESAGKKPQPCLCDPENRECKLTTRVSFMIPDVPGLGVWRLESHGWNAAVELPGTLEVLIMAASEHRFIPAVLRVEPRTKKVPGEGTRRFVVPVIELPGVTVRQLASGDVPLAINAPPPKGERPGLPAGPAPPAEDAAAFEGERTPGFGAPPALPGSGLVATMVEDAADSPPVAAAAGPGGLVPQPAGPDQRQGSDPLAGVTLTPPVTDEGGISRPSDPDVLAAELLELADARGKKRAVQAAIAKNRAAHADDPAAHEWWLAGQLVKARAIVSDPDADIPQFQIPESARSGATS